MPELLVRGIPGLHAHWYLDGNEYIVQVFGGRNKIDGWWASAEATDGELTNIYAHEHYVGQRRYIGTYNTPEDAALAYNDAAMKQPRPGEYLNPVSGKDGQVA